MQKEKKDKHFIKKPVYPGGQEALRKFIKSNLKYPDEALEAKVEGTVSLKYTINYKGDVIDAKVISGIGYGCDEEATRLAKLLKFQVPKTRKLRVKFHKDLHVHFRLPKQKPAAKVQLQYTYTTSTSHQKKGVKPNVIQYTITKKKTSE